MTMVRRSYTRSLELFARARELIPGGSQTISKRPTLFAYGQYPIFASHGQGGRIWDVDGNEYVDFVMALGPITLGYCYPAVDEAIRAQLAKGIVYGLLAEAEVAAVFLDPFASILPDPGFLEGVKQLTHAHGALLVFDEIVTGFRLALGGAQEYFGVFPDLAAGATPHSWSQRRRAIGPGGLSLLRPCADERDGL